MASGQRKEDDREAERGSDRQLKLVPGHCRTSPAAGYRFSGDPHCPGNDVARNDLVCLFERKVCRAGQELNFSETWSWRWLSGRLRKFNKIEAKSIGAFA